MTAPLLALVRAWLDALAPKLLALTFAGFAFVIWSLFAAWHAHVKPADFYVFWAAARHISAPYDPQVVTNLEAALHIQGAWPFVYPPTFLLFVWPFAQAPLSLAYPLWTGTTAALFTYAAARLVRPAWATALLFITPPVALAVAPGQTSLLVGAAMLGGWLCLKDRPRWAGLLFAIAACIKPQAMILAPVILWGHWRCLRWAAAGGLALVLASLVFGPARWVEWAHAVAGFRAVVPATERVNPSALIASPCWSGSLAAFGVALAWKTRNLVGLIAGGLCLTPYAHEYDLAPLAPLVIPWLFEARRFGLGRAAAGAAVLAGAIATPLAALAFLAGLAFLEFRPVRPEVAVVPASA